MRVLSINKGQPEAETSQLSCAVLLNVSKVFPESSSRGYPYFYSYFDDAISIFHVKGRCWYDSHQPVFLIRLVLILWVQLQCYFYMSRGEVLVHVCGLCLSEILKCVITQAFRGHTDHWSCLCGSSSHSSILHCLLRPSILFGKALKHLKNQWKLVFIKPSIYKVWGTS